MPTDQGFPINNVQAHEILPAGRITYIQNGDGTFSPATAAAAGGLNVVATAVAPTLVEGSSVSLSSDLSGQLRIGGTINASSSAKATTADPSYVNNTDNSFSQNLAGYLRVIAKQTGGWTVGIDQTTPGTTNAVDVTNFPLTVDVNSGVKSNSTIRVVLATDQPTNSNPFAVSGTFWQATQPISAASLPLPTGAATAAGLTTINTTLGTPFQAGGSIANTSFAATQSGTWNIGTITTITGITTAFGATASGVPANAGYTGGRVATAVPTAGSDGNLLGIMLDKFGRVVTTDGNPIDLKGKAFITLTSSTAETTLVAAGGAGVFNHLRMVSCKNSSAIACEVEIRDVTGGSVIDTISVPPNETRGWAGPVMPQTTANSAWTAKCLTSVASMKITVLYDISK